MEETMAPATLKPVWIDLSSSDAAASRDFYSRLFGWEIQVSPDPQYGGYSQAQIGGKDVAGIGPKMMPEAPTAWSVYIGTADIVALAAKVQAAGGNVIAPPMQVGDQGSMAVFQDPAGAFISAWQPAMMAGGLVGAGAGTFGWAELSSRGLNEALPFYKQAFGWDAKVGTMGEGGPRYIEFRVGDDLIAGAQDMNPMVPPEVPSYWLVYFSVDDVDASLRKALEIGAREVLSPMDFAGGRFAIVSDPQGASFGLLKMTRA
ncbi:MAG TPA: VOC family protein [Candidatus Limnocylindrales bacterium]